MIKFLFLLVWILLAFTVAACSSPINDSSQRKLDQQPVDGGDDDSWPVGTNVYWEFVNDGWYEGTITDYDADGYTITWCDDSLDYDDFSDEDVDQMVQKYKTMVTDNGETASCGPENPTPSPTEDDSWSIGTKVYSEFDDGWYQGTITDYDVDGYTITWCDDSIDYDDFSDENVDQMVENYNTMVTDNGETASCGPEDPTPSPTEDDSWSIGTKVYSEFDDGWYQGTITDYDVDGYTITWCDDSIDYDDFSDENVDQMVENYNTIVTDNGGTASCGPEDTVANGKLATSSSDGMKTGAKLAVVAVVLVAVLGGVFYVRRLRVDRKEEMQDLRGANRDATTEIA
jgi:ribosomal protein S6